MSGTGISFAHLTDEDRERIRRELTGIAARELVKRGDVYHAIRTLRVSDHSLRSADYQKALSDVQRAVSNIAARAKVSA